MTIQTICRRTLTVCLCVLLCLSLFPYVTPSPVSAAYENTYVNTGNQAQDLIGVAKTQLGYVEGSNNYNKYSESFGNAYQPWCGHFISWCARQAGIPEAVIPSTGRSTAFFSIGTYHSRASGYAPRPGDIMLYGVYGDSYHVSIVERYDAATKTVYVLDGNWSDKVSSHSTTLSNAEVAGFVTPNYTSDVTELTAFNMVTPSVIAVGSSYSISGYITSPNVISSVNLTITDASGKTCVAETATPNAKSYDLSALDAKVKFGSLSVGEYAYTVTATDSKETKRWAYVFEVVSEVDMTIADVKAPTKLDVGKTFSIYGKISCPEKLLSVSVGVYDQNGVYKTGGTATPGTTTYDIHGIDNYVSFGKLAEGYYTMTVSARSANGAGKWDYPFTVGNPAPLVTEYALDGLTVPETIDYGGDITVGGTITASDVITKVDAVVVGESGETVLTSSATPNNKTYEISPLDSALTFDKLSVGNYTLKLTATAANGTKTWDFAFAVVSNVKYELKNPVYPTKLDKGASFSISGTVECDENLTKVSVIVKAKAGETVLSASGTPNATTYRLGLLDTSMKFGSLADGEYVYTIVAESANGSKTWEYPFTVGTPAADEPEEPVGPTFTLTGAVYPSKIGVGSAFSVYGTVTCEEPLKKVTVQVVDSTGAVKINVFRSVTAKTFDIHTLDNDIAFGKLTGGNYVYKIIAESANGQQIWQYSFTVDANVVFELVNPAYPTHLAVGASCSISGTITSSKPLTQVKVSVVDASGKDYIAASATPNTTSYRIGYLDTSMKFGSLKSGRYIYKIYAKTAQSSKTWEYIFTVGDVSNDLLAGDVCIDDVVNSLDVMTMYSHVAGTATMNATQLMYAGADTVNMNTVMTLYNFVAGKATNYP